FKEHKTHRCLSCADWLSGLADISVIDGDPNIFTGSVQGASSYQKHGTLLLRSQIGRAVFASACKSGAILVAETALCPGNLGLERRRCARHSDERQDLPLSAPPIPGYVETGEVLDDEALLAASTENARRVA